METILSPTKIEFLLKLKALLIEYNTYFSCNSGNKIWLIVLENELYDDNLIPIEFPSQFDDNEIDELLENNRENLKKLELVKKQ